jgi:hypothetical protein
VRPVFTGDNPLSSVLVNSCAYNDNNVTLLTLNGQSYIIVDNFEFTGFCWSTTNYGSATVPGHSYTNWINSYWHGWSSTIGSDDDYHLVGGGSNGTSTNHNVWDYDIWDGWDALNGTTRATNECASAVTGPPCRSGYVFGGESYQISHSVFNNVSQGMVTSQIYRFNDNLMENVYATYDGVTHPNGIESNNGQPAGLPMYIYNNVFLGVQQAVGVGLWPEPVAGPTGIGMLFFNNVVYSVNPGNCIMYDKPSGGGPAVNVYYYNNTTVAPCEFLMEAAHIAPTGTATFGNNHLIGYSSLSGFYNLDGTSVTITDKGGEIPQSSSTATSQGYTSSNYFAPTASSNATVGAGTNNASFCNTIGDATVATACQSSIGSVTEQAGSGGMVAVANTPTQRPASGAWDVGAYQFDSGSASKPNPPTGLNASVL